MSNVALKSTLNSLEKELSALERYNRELKGELSTISNGVAKSDKDLATYNEHIISSLGNCNSSILNSHQRNVDAYELQGEIDKLYLRYKNIELANKKIRSCNNTQYYDFENYRTVRKIVQSLMDNIDLNLVKDEVIFKAIEKKHLTTPDYWLTCVLISIMAWKNDDKPLADRAMKIALELNKKSSAIFYMLFNIRMEKEEAALKWFNLYQECDLNGGDSRTLLMLFSLVSKTISEEVESNTNSEVNDFINRIVKLSLESEGYNENSAVEIIKKYFKRSVTETNPGFGLLKDHIVNYDLLKDIYSRSKSNINLLEMVLSIVNVPENQRNQFLKDYIDELILYPNQSEEKIFDDIAFNELIIKFEGDVEAAKEAHENEVVRREHDLNLVSEMLPWIYDSSNQNINGQMRLNMFTITKNLQLKAFESHVEDYMSKRSSVLEVKIDEYCAEVDLTDEANEITKIKDFYNKDLSEKKSKLKNWKSFILFAISLLSLFGAIAELDWLYYVSGLTLVTGIALIIVNAKKKKSLERICRDSIHITSEKLRSVKNEFNEFNNQIDEYHGYFKQIKDVLQKI